MAGFNGVIARLSLAGSLASSIPVAILGDSITAHNSTNTATQKSYNNYGYFTWFNILSNQSFYLPLANNFGNSGDTLSQIAARVGNVISSGARVCFIMGGTNDIPVGTSFATMKQIMAQQILAPLFSAQIQPIIIAILPRGGLTQAQNELRCEFNVWLSELALGSSDALAAAGFSPGKNILFSDPSALLTDQPTGAPIANYFDELGASALHPNVAGAYVIGNQLLADVGKFFSTPNTHYNDFFDVYDATNNPGGNLIASGTTNTGMCVGTGGAQTTNAGVTPTGVTATGFKIFRGNGTSTATLVGSKDSPRTDTINGNGARQILTVSSSSSGATFENYDFREQSTVTACVPGDIIVGECSVQLATGSSNCTGINYQVLEAGPASPQTASACLDEINGALSNVVGFTGFSGILRTPPITLQTGFTAFAVDANVMTNSTLGGGGAAATAYIGDVRAFKLQPY